MEYPRTGWVEYPALRTAAEPTCKVAPTRKRPSHALAGIGRFSYLYSECGSLQEVATIGTSLSRAVTTLLLRAACLGLPGPTGISPSHSSAIRSQDGPSCIHRISASFGILGDSSSSVCARGTAVSRVQRLVSSRCPAASSAAPSILFPEFGSRAATLYALVEDGMIREPRNDRERELKGRLDEWIPSPAPPPLD